MNNNNIDNEGNNDCEKSFDVDIETDPDEVDKVVDIISRESLLVSEEDKRIYLIGLYDICNPVDYNKETLDTLGSMVRNKLVRNVKFIENEHTSGLSKEGIVKARSYPSFWKPDLTKKRSLQNDIFREFPNLSDATLFEKVEAWMGMRDKVLHAIRSHRNATHTAIQMSIVEGKYYCISNYYFYNTRIIHNDLIF